jgi:hypothetical protein
MTKKEGNKKKHHHIIVLNTVGYMNEGKNERRARTLVKKKMREI